MLASTSTDNTVTYDSDRSDGDDQPGSRPGRPDQRFADQLHRGLQRTGDRTSRPGRDAERHGRGNHGDRDRQRHDLQRGRQRHDRHGTVIASIAAGVAQDAAGNANTASTSTDNTVTYDVTAPTVTINQAAGQADPTNASPINFTVVFSEPVTDFAPAM